MGRAAVLQSQKDGDGKGGGGHVGGLMSKRNAGGGPLRKPPPARYVPMKMPSNAGCMSKGRRRGGARGVVPVVVEHLGDVQMIARERGDLIHPGAVLAVIDLREDALHGKGAAPRADVPGAAARGAGIDVRLAQEGAELLIEVRDDGPGVAAEELPRLSDLF